MIDCRTDAITRPTDAMWDAMRSAEPGWGMQREDPSINALEAYGAELSGMQAALFVPSGTMANLVALMTHTKRGDHVIVEATSHILWSEEWGLAYVCGLVPRAIRGELGQMSLADVQYTIREVRFGHHPHIALLCLENTHNMAGGTVMPLPHLVAISDLARQHEIAVHLDGARVLNACAATGERLEIIGRRVDTLTINLNKGLSGPGGALLCGPESIIDEARLNLKRLGGWSVLGKAGPWAAAGLVALKTMIPQLGDDNRRARMLAEELRNLDRVEIDLATVQTNIVMVHLHESLAPAARFLERLERAGVRAHAYLDDTVRFVIHRHVTDDDIPRLVSAVSLASAQAW